MRINGHGHILPDPSQIPEFMKKKKLFWIDKNKKFMRQGNWSRPISSPGFFINEKLDWMNEHNIDHAVMRRGGYNREESFLDLGLVNVESTNFIPMFCVFIEIRFGGRFSRLANFGKPLPVTIEFGIICW